MDPKATKALLIANAMSSSFKQPRRRGVDKSSGGTSHQLIDLPSESSFPIKSTEQDVADTQPMEADEQSDERILNDVSDDADAEFEEMSEEIIREEARQWLAEYAPKLFNLASTQWITKKEKSLSKISPAATSQGASKKRKS